MPYLCPHSQYLCIGSAAYLVLTNKPEPESAQSVQQDATEPDDQTNKTNLVIQPYELVNELHSYDFYTTGVVIASVDFANPQAKDEIKRVLQNIAFSSSEPQKEITIYTDKAVAKYWTNTPLNDSIALQEQMIEARATTLIATYTAGVNSEAQPGTTNRGYRIDSYSAQRWCVMCQFIFILCAPLA